MKIKIENNSSRPSLPARTEENIKNILKVLPREHILGIDRIRLVGLIQDPRLRSTQKRLSPLPGLYHPRQGSQLAWMEISLDVLLPTGSFRKRFIPKLTFKANLAMVLFSLVGQHHFLTLRHSVKKGHLESSVKEYTEKNVKKWNEQEHSFRARLLKPFQPILERWAKNLQRRVKKEKK